MELQSVWVLWNCCFYHPKFLKKIPFKPYQNQKLEWQRHCQMTFRELKKIALFSDLKVKTFSHIPHFPFLSLTLQALSTPIQIMSNI